MVVNYKNIQFLKYTLKFVIVFTIIILTTDTIYAQYKLQSSVIGSGGTSTGSGYNLSGSVYQTNVGISSDNTNYDMNIGFWYRYMYMYKGSVLPVITTKSISSISNYDAVSGGYVIFEGLTPVTARGAVWSKNAHPTLSTNLGFSIDGSGQGDFSSDIIGLELRTIYYVRAYATNSNGTTYGKEMVFTSIPTLPEWALIVFGALVSILAVRKIIKLC